ncbi:CarD family transcriptional regulator [Blautia schinkii]|nr:CarD family transcriptional regulator [Blautia schinkii]
MFKKGDYIVYGHTGICQVLDVTTMDMDGISKDRLYYVLRPDGETDGKIFTPVDNTRLVIRRILSKQEAEDLLDIIPEIEAIDTPDDKLREEKYKQCIKSCDCRDLVRIIKTIYQRKTTRVSNGKKVTATDERYLKLAEENLYSELSKLLGIPKNKMESYITAHVQKLQTA